MKHGTCIHYTGLSIVGDGYKSGCCKAGVNYFETFNGRLAGIMLRMPCIAFHEQPEHGRGTRIKPGAPTIRKEIDRKGEMVIPCPHRREPTDEEVQAARREDEEAWVKTMSAIRIAAEWRVNPKPERDRYDVIECPVCSGHLHLSQSSHNGHCSGECETDGCVRWME